MTEPEPVPSWREVLAGYISAAETPVDGVITFLRETAMHASAAAVMAPDEEAQTKATDFATACEIVAEAIEGE